VIAFLTNLAEHVGAPARFVHQGMTSSDVLDTCLAVQLAQASDLLLAELDRLLAALEARAKEHKDTLCVGRSHGIHAEPTTFGLKLAGHYAAFARGRERLVRAREEIATCAISGAVGTFANIDPAVERHVAEKMGLKVEPVSTQVIPRDRHAAFFATLGVLASSIENLATEIRHLQRSEVREAAEYFAPGQKGSSAMPHKRNPVLTENLTGLARVVRAAVVPALENVTLWHERDISHSSVERVFAPDATIALHFALGRLAGVIDPGRHEPGGRLRRGPGRGHEGLGRGRRIQGPARGGRGGGETPERGRTRGLLRPHHPRQAGGHHLRPGIRPGMNEERRPKDKKTTEAQRHREKTYQGKFFRLRASRAKHLYLGSLCLCASVVNLKRRTPALYSLMICSLATAVSSSIFLRRRCSFRSRFLA
jgi:hypothetical protein